ncbi:hypothetical protein LCGC14_0996850 [marine sediment metagenome]|uniref:HNH domain-containing protein n=1 Tax=marine sediment metagenome TaxID=412755 RepID=A0A0F9QMN7_9ZZZZ
MVKVSEVCDCELPTCHRRHMRPRRRELKSMSAKHLRVHRAKKKARVDALAARGACTYCDSRLRLRFRRRERGEKKQYVSQMLGYRWERILELLQDYVIVCEDCTARSPVNHARLLRIKRLAGCRKCGVRSGKLEFHHRNGMDPEVDFTVSRIEGRSWSVIEAEMAKCVVLCRSCHRRFHDLRRRGWCRFFWRWRTLLRKYRKTPHFFRSKR